MQKYVIIWVKTAVLNSFHFVSVPSKAGDIVIGIKKKEKTR